MPYVAVNGTRLWVEDSGPGSTGETLVFSHGLLMDSHLFAPQAEFFRERYRCIRYDHRGQGRSDDSPGRIVTIEQVYDDAVALIEALALGSVHFCGLSMGGFVGLRLGARRPDLLRSLVLLDTSAAPEPRENVPRYRLLNFVAGLFGVGVVAGRVMPILFGKDFLGDPARAHERAEWRTRLKSNRRSIVRAVRGVIERSGVEQELPKVTTPTLVLVGEQDVATVPARAEQIVAGVRGSRLVRVPRAGHSSSVEQPDAVNAAIDEFLRVLSA